MEPTPRLRSLRLALRPTLWLLAAIAVLLAWRGLALWSRAAMSEPAATLKGLASGILRDTALATSLFALARISLLGRTSATRRIGNVLCALFALVLASCGFIRAIDTIHCYLGKSHFSADAFGYFDPEWISGWTDPVSIGFAIVSIASMIFFGFCVWRDAHLAMMRLPLDATRLPVGLALLLLVLPGALAVQNALKFPPHPYELRLVPELNFAHQWLIWSAQPPPGGHDVPPLPAELQAKFAKLGLMPAQVPDAQFPLLQTQLDPTPFPFPPRRVDPRPNVVVTLVESFSSTFVAELSGHYRGLMPETGKLLQKMTLVDGFYNTTAPTIAGVIGSMCSLLTTSHPRDLATGQRPDGNTPFVCLADILRQRGYRTVFVQPTSPNAMGVEAFLRTHGFDEVHAKPQLEKRFPGRDQGPFGLHDDALLEYATEQLTRLEKLREQDHRPFLLVMLTIDTHEPGMADPQCAVPAEVTDMPTDSQAKHVLAAYHCTDAVLGKLGRLILDEPRKDSTLWLLTADHAQLNTMNTRPLFLDKEDGWSFSRVPMLIHDPLHELPGRVQVWAGTTDIAPTLLHILGIVQQEHSMSGHSMFGLRREFPALVGRIGARTVYFQNGEKRVELAGGELRHRCDNKLPMLTTELDVLDACEFVQWLDWQDALWEGKRLFPRKKYLGDKGADALRLNREATLDW